MTIYPWTDKATCCALIPTIAVRCGCHCWRRHTWGSWADTTFPVQIRQVSTTDWHYTYLLILLKDL